MYALIYETLQLRNITSISNPRKTGMFCEWNEKSGSYAVEVLGVNLLIFTQGNTI